MAPLTRILAAVALITTAPAHADAVARWQAYIDAASARCGIPPAWIARVMRVESAGRTSWNGLPITSRAGAMGLMQLMPATWSEMRAALTLGSNPNEPYDNILAGACYLRRMYHRFGHPGMFAAYNAGPGRYAEYLAGGRSLPAETRGYLARVGGAVTAVAPESDLHGASSIFFTLRLPTDHDAAGLFVSLSGDRAPLPADSKYPQ